MARNELRKRRRWLFTSRLLKCQKGRSNQADDIHLEAPKWRLLAYNEDLCRTYYPKSIRKRQTQESLFQILPFENMAHPTEFEPVTTAFADFGLGTICKPRLLWWPLLGFSNNFSKIGPRNSVQALCKQMAFCFVFVRPRASLSIFVSSWN